jgi:hypothetical protein
MCCVCAAGVVRTAHIIDKRWRDGVGAERVERRLRAHPSRAVSCCGKHVGGGAPLSARVHIIGRQAGNRRTYVVCRRAATVRPCPGGCPRHAHCSGTGGHDGAPLADQGGCRRSAALAGVRGAPRSS